MPDVRAEVTAALTEDVDGGDLTASLLPPDARLDVDVITRKPGIIAGRPWFDEVFRQLDADIRIEWPVDEGQHVEADTPLVTLSGAARALLTGERTALNFLQLLSGTATLTRQYVEACAGTGTIILDTRKTIPGMRKAQKYAVRAGGGQNHRMGLFDALLIKENHIAAAGGIGRALEMSRRLFPDMPVEIEVETLEELAQAIAVGAGRALLDNFSLTDLRTAANRYRGEIELEASGGITLETVRAVAETGVDYISIGDLTKRIEPLDLSMRFNSQPATRT